MLPSIEEVRKIENEIRSATSSSIGERERKIAHLKINLRAGLAGFEDLLKEMRPQDRTAALLLYLERLRREAFQFHMAVQALAFKRKLSGSREAMMEQLRLHTEKCEALALLYGYTVNPPPE